MPRIPAQRSIPPEGGEEFLSKPHAHGEPPAVKGSLHLVPPGAEPHAPFLTADLMLPDGLIPRGKRSTATIARKPFRAGGPSRSAVRPVDVVYVVVVALLVAMLWMFVF